MLKAHDGGRKRIALTWAHLHFGFEQPRKFVAHDLGEHVRLDHDLHGLAALFFIGGDAVFVRHPHLVEILNDALSVWNFVFVCGQDESDIGHFVTSVDIGENQ